jgi:outer membrane protein assembly factor BamB
VTGQLRVAADVRPPVPPVPTAEPVDVMQWLMLIDDLVLVTGDDGRTLTAYGLATLDRRWSATWDGSVGWYPSPACGDMLCTQANDGRVRAVDRRTGQVRWQQSWTYVEQMGPMLLASRGQGPYGGEAPLALVDPATGEAVAELGTWAIAGRTMGVDTVLVKVDAVARKAWFARVDPAARDVRLLGVATNVIGDCRVGQDSVVCRRRDSSIGIWRYR